MTVTESVPTGGRLAAAVGVHEAELWPPVPATKVTPEHSVVEPTVNVAVPVGGTDEPAAELVTVAEYPPLCPYAVGVLVTEAETVVAAATTVTVAVAELPP